MKIFQMKTKPHGVERFREFIDQKFVCIGWPGIGNLTQVSKDEIRDRLEKAYNITGHKLGNALGQVNTFVNTMKAGDVVIIAEKDWAYIGTVGDYTYEPQYDNDHDGMCHRRSVEWIDRIHSTNLDSSIQRLINNRNTICEYPEPIEESGLDKLLGKRPAMSKENSIKLDQLFNDALKVLEEELKSTDPERRLRAAAELLKLKNS
jgi:predicted Mrr-cat superfamily restriction endonuclease